MCCLKSDELEFVNTFSANIFAILCYVHFTLFLLNGSTGTIQVTEGHKHLPRGPHAAYRPHVGQPCSRQMLQDYIKLGHFLFHSHTLPVYLLLFTLQFDAVISHLPTASFNKLFTNKNETCIVGVTCSTSISNLLYVSVAFLTTLSVVFLSVEGLTYTHDVRERFFFLTKFSMNSDHNHTDELVAMIYPLLRTHQVHSTLSY